MRHQFDIKRGLKDKEELERRAYPFSFTVAERGLKKLIDIEKKEMESKIKPTPPPKSIEKEEIPKEEIKPEEKKKAIEITTVTPTGKIPTILRDKISKKPIDTLTLINTIRPKKPTIEILSEVAV